MHDLNKLFYWHGIAEDYFNYKGDHVKVALENRINLLRTMGVNVDSKPALIKEAFEVDVAPWLCWLPGLSTQELNAEHYFEINLNPEELSKVFSWQLLSDKTLIAKGEFIPEKLSESGDYQFQNTRYTRRRVELQNLDLKPGYYRLKLTCGTKQEISLYAVIPETTWQPTWTQARKKLWGVIIQLYTLRSDKDWGIGDFGDLKRLIEKIVEYGVDVIGLNPLHTLLPDLEYNCSPYSPSDRRFLNPLYIDVEVEPDFFAPEVQAWLAEAKQQKLLDKLRFATHVDYCGVNNLKYACFERMFLNFKNTKTAENKKRYQIFKQFIEQGGIALQALGLYEGMYRRWQDSTYEIPANEEIWSDTTKQTEFKAYCDRHFEVIEFHLYLQWISACQLEQCQTLAVEQGMDLGLIRDLAVGANGNGCEVKSNSKLFCLGASVGAPPDPFSDLGQNWGIPPMDPAELRQSAFKHYIDLLRTNMTSCGALRIDHAMSLLRLWWCPPDKTADHGAYVYYPFAELVGLLKLESYLNKCAIIGEDLGVVPPEFREAMAKAKVFANKVFYFEKENFHFFKPPQAYDQHALAMVNNHDVPTLTSWWDATDLVLRNNLNLFEEGVDYEQMCLQRRQEKEQACELLRAQNLFPSSWEKRSLEEKADSDMIYAFLKLNAKVESQIFVIQLEDLLLMDAPTNVPGTFKEYPNWQRKLDSNIEDMFANKKIQTLLKEVQQTRTVQ